MTGPRELWVLYRDTPRIPELIVDGTTSDLRMLDLYHSLFKRESNAWLLHLMGQLPDWWRLINKVWLRNLTEHRNPGQKPMDPALHRWKSANARERIMLQRGWRVVQGVYGGHQIYQVPPSRDTGNRVESSLVVEELEVTLIESAPPVTTSLIIPEQKLIRV